jgi:hypothetical protein
MLTIETFRKILEDSLNEHCKLAAIARIRVPKAKVK